MTIPKITKKNLSITMGLLLSIGSIFYIYSYVNKPSTQPNSIDNNPRINIVEPKDNKLLNITTTQVNISDQLLYPQVPESLSVYSSSSLLNQSQVATKLASYFKLTAYPERVGEWYNSDFSISLNSNVVYGFIQYKVDGYNNPSVFKGPNIPTSTSALAAANKIVDLLPELGNLKPDISKVEYYINDGTHLEPATELNYNAIKISYYPYIGNIPILYSNETEPTAFIIVSQNDQIFEIYIKAQKINTEEELRKIQVKSQEEVVSEFKNGQALIIDTTGTTTEQVTGLKLPPISIQRFELQYRFSPKQKTLVPVILAEGIYQYPNYPEETINMIVFLEKN